jgi:hypothetical protein
VLRNQSSKNKTIFNNYTMTKKGTILRLRMAKSMNGVLSSENKLKITSASKRKPRT